MKTRQCSTVLALAISIVAASGCLHHRTMVACATAPGESECWESARTDADGRLQHHIVERVTPGVECDTAVIEQTSFADGMVIQRVKDTRRCRVVDHRITDRYELSTGRLHRVVAEDLDHDDRFDVTRAYEVALSQGQRLFALTTGWQRMVRLQERLHDDVPRAMMATRR
jgi:hypothetical protein